MKQVSRTSLPDTINYNGKEYILNRELSSALHDGKIFDTKRCIQVNVLQRTLKGKRDLHGKPYQPTKWIYTQKPAK